MNIQVRDVYELPLTMVGEREACLGAALAIFDRLVANLIILTNILILMTICMALSTARAIFDKRSANC